MATGWRQGGDSPPKRVATYDTYRRNVRNDTNATNDYEGLRAAARGPQEEPLNGGDAGIFWAEYSPYPTEAAIAGRRYKQLAPLYTDPWALLMAVAEAAFEGHHAAGACRGDYLRSRAARIRETVYAEQKAERVEYDPRRGGLHRPAFDLSAFGMAK